MDDERNRYCMIKTAQKKESLDKKYVLGGKTRYKTRVGTGIQKGKKGLMNPSCVCQREREKCISEEESQMRSRRSPLARVSIRGKL